MQITEVHPDIEHRDDITYWLMVLEGARVQGRFVRAAEADRQLRRLGVVIQYGVVPMGPQAVADVQ
ncbi:MAG TPA: hypothetical protein VF624_01365 [Tepidisphaeraceae bacterium]|jgi:hypothetical protein